MSTALQLAPNTLPVAVNEDGLQYYLQRVNAVPLLDADEEKELATRYREKGDLLAAERLVLAHLRYVARIAKMYQGYGLAMADLIQEGTVGLMKAVKRYDPSVGVRLVSFAVHWIKSEIHEFIIRNWRIVKVATTKAQRKLFFNIRQAKKRLGWFSKEEVKAVAADLGVSQKDVVEMEMRMMSAHDDTFDSAGSEEEGDFHFSPSSYLAASPDYEPAQTVVEGNWEASTQERLQHALEGLDPRSLDVVSERWLSESKCSLKELAIKYGVSIERIRQIEKSAMEKLRSVLSQEELVSA